MANTLDLMDIKQIITLHLNGFSNRKIGNTLGISRNTVNTYMHLFDGSKYSLEELLKLDHSHFNSLFSSHTTIVNDIIIINTSRKARILIVILSSWSIITVNMEK